jgi:hypothetical protein
MELGIREKMGTHWTKPLSRSFRHHRQALSEPDASDQRATVEAGHAQT